MKLVMISILLIIIIISFTHSQIQNTNNSTQPPNPPIKKQDKVTIFIIAHKDFKPKVTNKYVYKILTDSKDCLKDKYDLDIITTDHNNALYNLRKGYSELSKYYWVYKNYRPLPKYIGFNHYRRHFNFLNAVPNMDKIFKQHDVILTTPQYRYGYNSEERFKGFHFNCTYDEYMDIIREHFPEYYNDTVKSMSLYQSCYNNMFIMRSEDFLKLGDFIFGVSMMYDKMHNFTKDEDVYNYVKENWDKEDNLFGDYEYQARLEGFIIERIINGFYLHNFKFPLYFDNDFDQKNFDPFYNKIKRERAAEDKKTDKTLKILKITCAVLVLVILFLIWKVRKNYTYSRIVEEKANTTEKLNINLPIENTNDKPN